MIHIGVLSPVTGGFYFGDVLAGVVREACAAGARVTLVQTLEAGRTGDEFVPAPELDAPIGWDRLDGFLTIAQAASETYLERLARLGKPVVVAANSVEIDAPMVVADNGTGVRTAVAHLVEHGHTAIAFVGNIAQTDMRERHEAYRGAMAAAGLPVPDAWFVPTPDHVETGGADAAPRVHALLPEVTAVVASTDRIALGLMGALQRMGVTVPGDLAMVGFDDVEAGWRSSPPLATVNQKITEIGATAARLLLARMRGEDVGQGPHVVPSTFVPRRSCGCTSSTAAAANADPRGVETAEELVAELLDRLGLTAALAGEAPSSYDAASSPWSATDPGSDLGSVALEELLEERLRAFVAVPRSPETVEQFTEALVRGLADASSRLAVASHPGVGALAECLSRATVALAQLQAMSGLERSDRLVVSLGEQYDVGMGLLGGVSTDPSDLAWLRRVSVRLGCLGLWQGPPADGVLRVAGVYDPDCLLTEPLEALYRVQDFPPAGVADAADPGRDEVMFVLPLRGRNGDHGLLCLLGTVDTQVGTGRATYNHWAALLGVALKQQRLLEHVRGSEERYSLAAAATQDGLWDWDVDAGTCYWSPRCEDMLATGDDAPLTTWPRESAEAVGRPELAPWAGRVHPDDVAALNAALRRAVTDLRPFEVEHRVLTPEGERWLLCRGLPVGDPGRSARRVVGSLADIHPRKALEDQLRQAALYDAVTGLPNRRLFLERLDAALACSNRTDGTPFAVVFLDLDGFKLINDSLGHLAGDQLLEEVAERLRTDLRSVDTAARFGGDEFAVLLVGLGGDALLTVVDRLQERIAAPILLGDQEVAVSASVGIARSESGYTDAEDVLRDADIAMYHAKESERGTASVFDPAMHTRATGRLRAQGEIRTALQEQQFVVHYQPMIALAGAGVAQFEALVRWEHPERGVLAPSEFLPVMAETGMIVSLGQWIVDAVCAQVAQWREGHDGPVTVSVNLSHREFWSEQLLLTVTQALRRHDVPPRCLVLEITESVIMADPEAARQVMTDLRAAGIRLHIDDFGTGQSSLHALRAFPVDALKIDQSFVQALDGDRQTAELVRIIVAMGRTLGIEVVAEGVETESQADQLRAMGCATAQGWLYAPALSGADAGSVLGTRLDAEYSRPVTG